MLVIYYLSLLTDMQIGQTTYLSKKTTKIPILFYYETIIFRQYFFQNFFSKCVSILKYIIIEDVTTELFSKLDF